ncbi:hypothetical protein YC2023_066351 [Brassica napus]
MTSVAVCVCPCVSVSTHSSSVAVHQSYISTLVLGLITLTLPVYCSGDFSPRGLSVQYTQDVCGCPPAHTGRPWLSVCVRVCQCVSVTKHRTSVAIHQYTYQHVGPWTQHAGPSRGLFGRFCPTLAVCSVHTGRPWESASTHRTSMAVRQHTQDVRGCSCVSVCVRQHTQDVRGFPSAHTGRRPWLSISTHINKLVLGLSTLALPVDCSGDFGPRGLSVQYTQDVRGCQSAQTGCPSHTGHPYVSSAHTGRPWLSISTHISTLVLGLSTLTLPVDCSGDFGPRGLSVQYTQDVRGCPPAHTGRPWLSVSTHRTSVAVRVCPCVSVRTHRTSVGVHQHTQDVPVCPSAHTGHT